MTPGDKNKRICVFSDGTWQTPENPVPTNIVRLVQCIAREDPSGIQQVAQYDAGVGSEGSIFQRMFGGMFGSGIDKDIIQLYSFLSLNYCTGDEIYMFGFSRGAYCVRSLAGMIHRSGLVRRNQIDYIEEAYELYRSDVNADDEKARTFRQAHGESVPIKALVCFDTVGALGIPNTLFGIRLPSFFGRRYQFHDTTLHKEIEHAIHMVSIDEDKAVFAPTPMDHSPERDSSQVTRRFFWGGHGGVGGGNAEEIGASQNTLCFVVEELARRGCNLYFKPDEAVGYSEVVRKLFDTADSLSSKLIRFFGGRVPRKIDVDEMHWTAVRRYQEFSKWRPCALEKYENQIKALDWQKMQKDDQI